MYNQNLLVIKFQKNICIIKTFCISENILLNTCILKLRSTDWNNVTHKAETSFYVSLAPHFHGSPSMHEVIHTNVIYRPGKEWNNLKMPLIQVYENFVLKLFMFMILFCKFYQVDM